jgi:hypothetical protein
MKTALILIPDTGDSVNRYTYIQDCIRYAEKDGFTADCPALQESFSQVSQVDYLDQRLAWADKIYLFTDFGINGLMLQVIDRIIAAGRAEALIYKKLHELNPDKYYSEPTQILGDVCRKLGYKPEQLRAKTRKRHIIDASFVYYRRCREISKASLAQIGLPLGKDHATVLHGIKEAYNTENVKKLYAKCYEQTEVKGKALDAKKTEEARNVLPVERPVLPFNSMDPREQVIQTGESSLRGVSKGWAGGPFTGYRSHST